MDVLIIGSSNARTRYANELLYKLRNPLQVNGCVHLISGWLYYNRRNIMGVYQNNYLRIYDKKNDIKYFITIPDGSYNVSDINGTIKLIYNNESGNDIPYDIFVANPIYNRVTLYLTNDIEIELSQGLAYMLGAVDNSMDYQTYMRNASTTLPSLTNVNLNLPFIPKIELVHRVLIHCDIIDNPCQLDNTVLYSFTPKTAYGEIISIEPCNSLKLKTRNTVIYDIKIWLTDQDGNALDIENDMEFIIGISPFNSITNNERS